MPKPVPALVSAKVRQYSQAFSKQKIMKQTFLQKHIIPIIVITLTIIPVAYYFLTVHLNQYVK